MAISGTGLAATTAGLIFIWSAVKGTAPTDVIRSLIQGEQPSTEQRYPVAVPERQVGADNNPFIAPTADAAAIIRAAASKKGQPYRFGAGHSGDPCKSTHSDCSSYVCCVINTATGSNINMATGGLARYGTGVAYKDRQPGDIIVWNGGTGGGHCGIILTVSGNGGTMWHQPCTTCGGVQIGKYPFGTRTAQSAVVRRVSR